MVKRIQINVDPANDEEYTVKLSASWLAEALSFGPSCRLSRSDIRKLTQISAEVRRQIDQTNTKLDFRNLQRAGQSFFRTVFKPELKGKLLELLTESMAEASVRISLHIPESLAVIWWEMLYCQDAPLKSFLSAHPQVSFSRYTGSVWERQATEPVARIRILVVVAEPKNHSGLNASDELKVIKAALAERELVTVKVIQSTTFAKLKEQLSEFSPDIFHFIGHARFKPQEKSGLILVDEERRGVLLPSDMLATLLRRHAKRCGLVLLNACQTAVVEKGYDNSLAGELVQTGVPSVIGMQSKIPNIIALGLTDSFYTHLLDGFCRPVDWALNQARNSLLVNQLVGHSLGRYWFTPVLYCRARDGVLFERKEPVTEIDRYNRIQDLVAQLGRWRSAATRALIIAQLKREGPRAVSALALALESENPNLREEALAALEEIGGDTVDFLLAPYTSTKQQGQHINDSDSNDFPPPPATRIDMTGNDRDSAETAVEVQEKGEKEGAAFHDEATWSQQEQAELRKQARKQQKQARKEARARKKQEIDEEKKRKQKVIKKAVADRSNLISEIRSEIAAAQAEVEKFKRKSQQVKQEADLFTSKGEEAIKRLKKLQRWAKVKDFAKATVNSAQVSPLVDQTNQFLSDWSKWPNLIQKIQEREIEFHKLKKLLSGHQKTINHLTEELAKVEARHPVGFLRRLFWYLGNIRREVTEKRRQWQQVRLESTTKNMIREFEDRGRRITTEMNRVHGITIYTSDGYIHTITRERR